MTVKLEKKTIEISKLPLGRYAELTDVLQTIFEKAEHVNLEGSTSQFLRTLPKLITTNLPEVKQLLKIGANLSTEEIEDIGLAESIDLLQAIIEVNRYADVYETIKKVIAQIRQGMKNKNGSSMQLTSLQANMDGVKEIS